MSASRCLPTLDFDECPCSGGTLDRLIQPAVLAILADGPLHGYRLAERIGAMPGFARPKPDISGVYRMLKVMQSRGLVQASWDLSETGPAKKSYQITPQGRDCLKRWVSTLESYRDSVSNLLKVARKAVER